MSKTAGFTLVELMISTAIIAILSSIAVPTFLNYRDQGMVAQVLEDSHTIRAALSAYAATSVDYGYPPQADITDYDTLRNLVNNHGGRLPTTSIFAVQHYTLYDEDGDTIADVYSMRLSINGVQAQRSGAQMVLTPRGILKCTPSGAPC